MLNRIFHLSTIALMLFFCICWPFWLKNGFLDTTYLKVATFIATYGGAAANIVWYLKFRKNN